MSSTLFSPGTVYTSAWGNEVDKATHNYLTAVGGSNTITATGPAATVGYVAGDRYFIRPAATNTGAVTININALGAKAITKYGATALVAGDLVVGTLALIAYDGVQFQLQNPQTISPTVPVAGRLIGVQTITSTGTYTPTVGTTSIVVDLVGGGGAGAGALATAAGQVSVGAGGGAGGYVRFRSTSGFSGQTITIGAAGVGPVGGNGGNGGNSSFLSVISGGGQGGTVGISSAIIISNGGQGGNVSGGTPLFSLKGPNGGSTFATFATGVIISGEGADGYFGSAGQRVAVLTGSFSDGQVALGFGAGGGGSVTSSGLGATKGGNGSPGVCIIYEYS